MKKFSFTKIEMWFKPIFFTGSLIVYNICGEAAISRLFCPRRAEWRRGRKQAQAIFNIPSLEFVKGFDALSLAKS